MVKKEIFDTGLQEIATLARVLSHPARLAILEYLAKCNVCISGDISDEMPLSRTTVSQHLNELKNIGLIQGEVEGTRVHYCIDHKKVELLKKKLDGFFSVIISE
jgi:DNA-binding transcriptional ArsR family regulator